MAKPYAPRRSSLVQPLAPPDRGAQQRTAPPAAPGRPAPSRPTKTETNALADAGRAFASAENPLPARMASLPRDPARPQFVVPWFVGWPDGKQGRPDFRTIGAGKPERALKHGLCWLCGRPLDADLAFVIGPMCAISRTTSEPPCHADCAVYAARVCPFLTHPKMRRNEKDLPANRAEPAGIHLSRNPGGALVWVTRSFRTDRVSPGRVAEGGAPGVLFSLGEPVRLFWIVEGRAATRDEVIRLLRDGRNALHPEAARDGMEGIAALEALYTAALRLAPPAPPEPALIGGPR